MMMIIIGEGVMRARRFFFTGYKNIASFLAVSITIRGSNTLHGITSLIAQRFKKQDPCRSRDHFSLFEVGSHDNNYCKFFDRWFGKHSTRLAALYRPRNVFSSRHHPLRVVNPCELRFKV